MACFVFRRREKSRRRERRSLLGSTGEHEEPRQGAGAGTGLPHRGTQTHDEQELSKIARAQSRMSKTVSGTVLFYFT